MTTTPTRHEPGIYFGLDEDAYHADPALGSSDLKRLLTSPPDYWWNSWMNPAKPEQGEDKAHLVFGKAVHKMVLEGAEAFHASYAPTPDPAECIVNDADCEKWITDNAERIAEKVAALRDELTGPTPEPGRASAIEIDIKALDAILAGKLPKTKSGKVSAILLVDPEAPILDVLKTRAADAGIVLLPTEAYDRIITASAMIARNPHLATAFEGGRSEVSVFWERDLGNGLPPVPCKCRLDYLKLRAIGDLKSISNPLGKPLPAAARSNIASYRYDIQAWHYMEGRREIAALLRAGKVFGDHDPKWLSAVAKQKAFAFVFVFFQSANAPITWATSISPQNPLLDIGRVSALHAMENYQRFMRDFGTDAAWVLAEPVEELSLDEMPGWFGRG